MLWVPQEVTHLLDSVQEAQLLAAAAAVLIDTPNLFETAGLPAATRESVCRELRNACTVACRAVFNITMLQERLARSGVQEGWSLAAGAMRMLQHAAVRRLQVGWLPDGQACDSHGGQLEPFLIDAQLCRASCWWGCWGCWWRTMTRCCT